MEHENHLSPLSYYDADSFYTNADLVLQPEEHGMTGYSDGGTQLPYFSDDLPTNLLPEHHGHDLFF